MIKKRHLPIKNVFFYGALLKGWTPLLYVVGSWHAYFGLNSIIAPLSGVYTQGASYYLMWFALLASRMIFLGASPLSCFAFIVPGFCASLYYAYPSQVNRIGLPALCMMLFWLHPVGAAAFSYAFYWFIPLAVNLIRSNHPLAHAFGATFTAHAVGSVMWLYTVGMTPDQWLALIPVVAYERTIYAVMMFTVQCAVMCIPRYAKIALSRLMPAA